MALEGALRVGLRVDGGRVQAVRVRSTRPDVAGALLSGRTRTAVAVAVPLMFSICGRSQAAASALACAAAAGRAPTPETLARCSAAVAAERVREGAWRTLLDWPRWLGEVPADAAVAAARLSLGMVFDTPGDAAPAAIAHAAFGMPAADWLVRDAPAELERWADAGGSAAARFIRRVLTEDADAAEPAEQDDEGADQPGDQATTADAPPSAATALLDGRQHAAWVAALAEATDADPAFARAPTWRGAPAETGALARLQDDRLIRALLERSPSRVPARFVARLRELALLLAGPPAQMAAAVGATTLPSGAGVAWVENARGLLIHIARLDGERIVQYRIVAPTEWNFHPAGALAQALLGSPAGDPGALRQRSTRLVHSLDPCVECQVEFDDA